MFKKITKWFSKYFIHDTTTKMIEDFEKLFPDKCIICSYYRFGYFEGLIKDPTPPPHNCKESQL